MSGSPPLSPNRPGVAFALSRGLISGVDTWAERTAARLHAAGLPTTLFRYSDEPAPPRPTRVGHDRCEEVDAQQPVLGITTRTALRQYADRLPAIVVPNYVAASFAVCAELLRRRPTPALRVLGICHSFDPYYLDLLAHYEPIIERFVAVSDECAAALACAIPGRANAIAVRPCAVEVPLRLERSYASAPEPLRILYAGRIVEEQKNVGRLLDLAVGLAEAGVRFQLRIVGEGSAKPDLVRRRESLPSPVRACVSIEPGLGHAPMLEQIRQSDVAVLVSRYEGTSVFMLEALALGCVPVVTEVSGTAAVIDSGKTGFRVAIDDIAAMVAAIARLDRDRSLLAAIGAEGRRSAARFSQDAYDRWLRDQFEGIWAAPPRSWPADRSAIWPVRRFPSIRRCAAAIPGLPAVLRTLRRAG